MRMKSPSLSLLKTAFLAVSMASLLIAVSLLTTATPVDAQSDDPVTAVVVRRVTTDVDTFAATRDAYVADLEAQPGITADREFAPFLSFLTFGQPEPPVFIGMTSGSSLAEFQNAAGAVDEALTSAYFPTFESEFFDLLVPLDGTPIDISTIATAPGQVLEVAWRDLSSYDDFDQQAYESARDAYLAELASMDGWVAEYQWVSATGQPFAVGMTVYESQTAFTAIATDATFTSSQVYRDFVGDYPIAGGYASASIKPATAASGQVDELAFTGSDPAGLAIVGATLIAGGGLVVWTTRNERRGAAATKRRVTVPPTEATSFSFPFLPLYVGRAVWRAADIGDPIATEPHRHPHAELYLIDGAGQLDLDERELAVDGPTAIVVPPGALHRWTISTDLSLWVIGLKPGVVSGVGRQVRRLERTGPITIPPTEAAAVDALAAAAKRRFEERVDDAAVSAAYVTALVVQLADWAGASDPTSRTASLAEDFLSSVEDDGGFRRSVGAHAERLGVTPAHLSSVVSKELGATPKELIAERTLIEARRRLLQTSDSAASVAAALGFADASQFGRWFKRCTGNDPGRLPIVVDRARRGGRAIAVALTVAVGVEPDEADHHTRAVHDRELRRAQHPADAIGAGLVLVAIDDGNAGRQHDQVVVAILQGLVGAVQVDVAAADHLASTLEAEAFDVASIGPDDPSVVCLDEGRHGKCVEHLQRQRAEMGCLVDGVADTLDVGVERERAVDIGRGGISQRRDRRDRHEPRRGRQRQRVVDLDRPREEEALAALAAQFAQQLELVAALDALGDDLEMQRVGQLDDLLDDDAICGTAGQVAEEGAIDLELADRQPAQHVERRPPGTEVVDRQTDAELGQPSHDVGVRRRRIDELAFGDLEEQLPRRHTAARELGLKPGHEGVVLQAGLGQIHRHAPAWRRSPGTAPQSESHAGSCDR